MKFLARSVGALCVLGGLLVGAYLLSFFHPGPVQAGCGPAPVAAPASPPPLDPLAAPEPAPLAPVAAPAPVHPDSGQSIDQLMEHLTTLRAKKAELDRQEQETITLLREKLKQQRQKLEKLGIAEETPPPPAVVPGETPVLPQSGSVTPPTPAAPAREVSHRTSGPVFPVTPPVAAPEFPAPPPAVGADASPGSLTPPVPRPSTGPFRVLPASPIPQAHY